MNNENKDFLINDLETTNINEEEIVLAFPTELFDEAKGIAQNTKSDDKFPFTLQYDSNQKEFLLSMLDAVGAIVEDDDDDGHILATMMNMTQLAFIKQLDCVERVKTDEGINPFLAEEAVKLTSIQQEGESLDDEVKVAVTDIDPKTLEVQTEIALNRTTDAELEAIAIAETEQADGDIAVASVAATARSSCCPCPTNVSMETAETISDESYTSGYICCPGAEQWFKFVATRTGRYTICTTGSLDTIGTLYDCYGNQIVEVDDYALCGKINFRIICNLTAGNTYYVKVRVYGDNTGIYTLRVTEKVLANYVAINKDTIVLEKGVTYELPITPNYTYKGYNGAQRIPGLSVSINPSNADEQRIAWWEQYGNVLVSSYGWDDDGDRYIHVTATEIGTTKLYAQDWNEYGKRDECAVTVVTPYCGGDNYRDVTQHSMVLQSDGYYVCSRCGYRVKSPALQDKDILSEEDYYTVVSCYSAIPYYSKIDREDEGNYSVQTTALRLIIDNIRCQSQYAQKYEYVGNDGRYKREYTVGNENDDYYMPVTTNYNIIDNGVELALNNGVVSGIVELIIGWKIPIQYQFLFFNLTDGCSNITDFLSELAEKVGYKEISFLLKLILFGASADKMAITDRVVKIQFSVGAAICETKTVFDSSGNFKSQTHSVS